MDKDKIKKEKEEKLDYNPEITEEDIDILGERNVGQRTDGKGDDTLLDNREKPVDFAGKSLDVPGRSSPKLDQKKLKDEENQLHSQGSAHNDHLEDGENNKH